ncbi:MAG: 1-phosphofructokinase [Chloroflexota bacterium]
MIVVLSLNTAIDRIAVIPGFSAGGVYRAERSLACAGGKGLNVARAVRCLGEPVRVIGFLGGTAERSIRSACRLLGIDQRWVMIDGETRTCVIVVDPHADHQTVINEPGPSITGAEIDRLRAELRRSTREGDFLCISGSAPAGIAEDLYPSIMRETRSRNIRVLVDVSGPHLRRCWGEHPWALAPNYEESRTAFPDSGSPEATARSLATGAQHVLLTLGAAGVVYATNSNVWQVRPPHVHTVNAVGSGDAFAAGFLVGMARGYEALDALRMGTACGASNASRLEPTIGAAEEIARLMNETSIHRM